MKTFGGDFYSKRGMTISVYYCHNMSTINKGLFLLLIYLLDVHSARIRRFEVLRTLLCEYCMKLSSKILCVLL